MIERKTKQSPVKTLLILAAVALQMPAVGQKVVVAGQVVENGTAEPMPFANVAIMRSTDTVFLRGATTDLGGQFTIADADTGHCLLVVTSVGYESVVQPMHLVADRRDVEVQLTRGTMLDEVSISAERPLYSMDGEKNLYNVQEDPSVQAGTASDALQNAPGVEVDAEGNITLRGVSSVEVWINDRPSHMQPEALKQYIKQMPAGAIERIEVITNPSARYSTTGGVINIVTNQRVTRNELLCLGLRGRTTPSVSPWASYVYANERFDVNIYLNADYSRHRMYSPGSATLLDSTGQTSRYQQWADTTTSHNIGGYTGLNLNWNITDRTQLAAWVGVYPYWNKNHSSAVYQYLEYRPTLTDLGYSSQHDGGGLAWGGYGGLYLIHTFDTTGRRLTASVNGNTWNQGGTATTQWVYNNAALGTLTRRTTTDDRAPHIEAEVNYTHPLASGYEVEAGLSVGSGWSLHTRTYDTLVGQTYVPDIYQSLEANNRDVDAAAYATVQKRWGGFTAKLGLRGEAAFKHSAMQHPQLADRTVVDTTFLAPVPSLHLSYQTADFQNYSLSYTRRYASPSAEQLSPLRQYTDYSYSVGNPALALSYVHNVEAAWNKYLMGFGNIGLNAYYRANTGEVGTAVAAGYAPEYFGTALVNYSYPDNIGSSHTEGVEANITYRPTAMVNVRLNASLFNYGYNYNGMTDSRLSWSARLNIWAKVWGKVEVFANAHYSSPRLGLYSVSVPNKGVDFGISTDLLDRQLTLFLNVNDIFGMAEFGNNTTAPQYQTTGSTQYDSRFVSLGITWRIGKMELEGKARQGAAESPQM